MNFLLPQFPDFVTRMTLFTDVKHNFLLVESKSFLYYNNIIRSDKKLLIYWISPPAQDAPAYFVHE